MKLSFPLEYLKLENAWGALVIRRDIVAWSCFSIALSVPFIVFDTTNYFHKDGFLDKIGSFSSVLLGFYIAALIAVATLSSSFSDLDKAIEVGVIRRPSKGELVGESLTRREYICYMFGYMAFVSLFLALAAMIVTGIAPSIKPFYLSLTVGSIHFDLTYRLFRGILISFISVILGSLAVTTLRGLYYLVERLYEQEAEVDQSHDVNDA